MVRLVKEISPKQREWRNDPRIMAWTRGSELLSEEDQQLWLKGLIGDPTRKFFGIEVSESSKIKGMIKRPTNVGTCGLTSINVIHGSAEWSLLVGPEYQGKKYASAALKLLINYGLYSMRLNRIWGEIFDGNAASLHLAEKMGFKVEGKLRQTYYKNGKFIDSTIVGLLREEWKPSQLS